MIGTRMRRIFTFVVLGFLFTPSFLRATCIEQMRFIPKPARQHDRPVAFLNKTAVAPKIDGILNDSCWTNAARIEKFVTNETKMPAVEPVTGYVTYDENNLYIGIDATEGQIDILSGAPQGDKRDVWSGDEFEVFIDSARDGKTYYQFCVGSKFGQKYDGKSALGAAYNTDWDSAVTLDKEKGRVYLEFRIPAKAVEVNAITPDSLWGFNIGRQNVHTEPADPTWPKNKNSGSPSSSELVQWSPTGEAFHDVSRFGLLFFGKPEVFAKSLGPLHVDLILDREEYDNLDLDAQGILSLITGGRPLEEVSVVLRLTRGKDVVAEEPLPGLQTETVSFLLPVANLAAGDYTLEANITSGKDGKKAVSTWLFRRVNNGVAKDVKTTGRIALLTPERDVLPDMPWPVRTGVPFPKGALADPAKVRLLADGKEVPCQADVRARWSPRGSVRWLGLTFVALFNKGKSPIYELEYGIAGPAVKPNYPITVQQDEKSVNVIMEPLKFTLMKKDYDGVHAAWIDKNADGRFDDDECVVAATAASAPYVIDQEGIIYSASQDKAAEIEVEEAGPVHAVIRATGWFESQKGKRLCKYTTYYEIFAGLPEVFVDHTVVITYDTRTNKLKDVGFPVAAKGDSYTFGIDGQTVAGARGKRAFLVQDRWNHARIAGAKDSEGRRSSGWADVGTDLTGVTLTAQYVAERFPKEFSVDAQRLVYHLWPADLGDTFTDEEELERKNIYKLFFAHEGPALDFQFPAKYYEKIKGYAETESFYLQDVKAGLSANGQGVALNEPFVLRFRANALNAAQANDFAKLFVKDPNAVAAPDWTASTGVFGPMIGVDRENYPQLERYMGRSLLSMAYWGSKLNDEFGVWNFGDVHTYWYYPIPESLHPKQPYAGLHRVWLSHHYAQTEIPWLLYAHYGDPAILDWARINNHKTMNVSMVHHEDPSNPLQYHKSGTVYHVKGFVHWGGDTALASHSAYTSHLLWNWLMTGNRRARDVAREWQEGVIAESPPGNQGRDGETFLGEAAEYYQNWWEPRMLALMNRTANSVLSQPLSKQHAAYWNPATFPRYYGLTKNKLAWERLTEKEFRTNEWSCHLTAYAYLMTGEPQYLNEIPNLFVNSRQQYDNTNSAYDGAADPSWLNQMNQLEQMLVVQAALKKAGQKIERDRTSSGPDIITGNQRKNDFTLGVVKKAGEPIVLNLGTESNALARVKVTGPDGKPVTLAAMTMDGKQCPAVRADAPNGIYVFECTDAKITFRPPVKEFFLLKKGATYTFNTGSQYVIKPLKSGADLECTVFTYKRPAKFILYDSRGKEAANVSSLWQERQKLLIPAAGGPYTLLVTNYGFLIPGEDAMAVAAGSD